MAKGYMDAAPQDETLTANDLLVMASIGDVAMSLVSCI